MIDDHNLKIPEQEYRDLAVPSYSLLASVSKQGVDVFNGVKNDFFQLKFGSLVDDICFEPSKLVNYYHGEAVKMPSGNPKTIVDEVLANINGQIGENESEPGFALVKTRKRKISGDLNQYKTEVISAARKQKVYEKYNEDKIFNTVYDKANLYFSDRMKSRGKVLIKPQMWEMAIEAANTLKTHDFTKIYFEDTPGIQLIYQYKFVQIVNGIKVKGMLDCLVIDHENKTIYPVDLKTGESPVEMFDEVMLLHKYYLQASLYRTAIQQIVANDPDLKGYSVSMFEFVYLSKMNVNKPLIWIVPEELHEAGMNGFTDRFGFKHKGINELLDMYQYNKSVGGCSYEKEVFNNEGRKFLSNLIMK